MRNAPDALMLFAAGFGTRMGALTRDRPKPLIEVGGRALLDHALDVASGAGIGRIAVNTHYKAEQIQAHLAGRDIALAHEPDEILDTGGGLRAALPLLGDGPVYTMNTDAVWRGPNPLSLLAGAWDDSRMDALLLCLPPDQAIGHTGQGDFLLDAEGRVSRGPGLVYSGAQIIRTESLADIPDRAFSLNVVWNRMMAEGRAFGTVYPGTWCDVGHPGGIALAEAMLDAGDV
ncbi:MurNAc alpha-1-phosphate uridylyltransferase [Roseovarius nanhaiticus]|uniref:MurNAc alpha-1-phosphate uridylyltransferase n=1 Tax=Roseovarius nanhaiticus TaxID=573024 RepID=A0A1N7EI48_9RHOB|nr:nucleotidyltransferase family protein [Roseovarius nanhaiticus]SEK74271.1 MurNAc alpha-1-phosphate uridylyltransferase [Roseovarius nanhaiticus]SIR87668.1 MurNAc alpha-1-phosphate uridylyltransferase [Roseovarius nanhaiticus]